MAQSKANTCATMGGAVGEEGGSREGKASGRGGDPGGISSEATEGKDGQEQSRAKRRDGSGKKKASHPRTKVEGVDPMVHCKLAEGTDKKTHRRGKAQRK